MNVPEPQLESAIHRLIAAGLLFREGLPPHSNYLFKHALVQDAAYGTLLRKARRTLHARIAETLESQFGDIGERQPELLARHCAEAGMTERAADLWGKAGQRSLQRSALVEAAEQLTRALAQIETLPTTPALRRKQIELQVALITPLMHTKGYAAHETKAAAERARMLIERAETLGESPDDPLLLFSVLYSFWCASYVAFDGDALLELASEFLALAEKKRAVVPRMIGHRIMGSALHTGEFAKGVSHLDQAIALYDAAEHRLLATQFGQDVRVATLSYRSWALWFLGYPDAALADARYAVKDAREIAQAATLMYALVHSSVVHMHRGDYAIAAGQADELVALANEKGALFWKALGLSVQGCILELTGKATEAVHMITFAISSLRSTGSTLWMPLHLSYLARAYGKTHQFDDAWRSIGEALDAMETSKERWHEAEVHRLAGEIALRSPDLRPEAEKHFERALALARAQQAKSWELRAAISLARLKRSEGKREEARRQLALIHGWFKEGFGTVDLLRSKALLDELAGGLSAVDAG
jgi:tetratricopeptide (TPR) repeat protein